MTKVVRNSYVVEAGQTVAATNQPAFLLESGARADGPQLTNSGSITVEASGDPGNLAAIVIKAGVDNATIINTSSGVLSMSADTDRKQTFTAVEFRGGGALDNAGEIDATSKHGYAAGVESAGALGIHNDGVLNVRGSQGADGVHVYGTGELINTGEIRVNSINMISGAYGAIFAGDASIDNSGLIKAVGAEDADGVLLTGSVSHFENSGRIIAEVPNGSEGYAVGLQIYTQADGKPVVIDNTGLIEGGPAIHGGDKDGITLHNEGQIIGGVEFNGSEEDQVYNSGKMGSVYLGGGDDLYDGRGGKVSGGIWLDDGNNTGLGGTGSEQISAGAGTDELSGRGGDDTIFGGGGADRLAGGKGADHFVYNAVSDSTASAADTIKDLTDADTIDLSHIDANSQVSGNQAFTLVDHLDGHAAEAALTYDATANMTRLELDVNGDGQADSVILTKGDHHDFGNLVL